VSNIILDPALQDPPLEPAVAERRSWTWIPKTAALLLILFWLANIGISLLITHTRLQQRITGRLQSVFGRSVEVGHYSFSLWGGPTLEASPVTFAEDPRFGNEYFLRAESLTLRLRWQSLLRGHMELGTVSLTRPSLNLVRNAEGDWNLGEWLPRPVTPAVPSAVPNVRGPSAPDAPSFATRADVRFTRIEVEAGRINFKREHEKIPFAFISVNGYLEPDGPGRWRVNLEAIPTRVAVVLQAPGTVYLSGSLGGTSSRLRPASLDLAWGDASISDVLRLFRGYDLGVRGNLAVVVHAETQGDIWNLQTRSQLRDLHRWDLPLRVDNGALDVNARMILRPLASTLDVTSATIEAPASFAHATARFTWANSDDSSLDSPGSNRLDILQSEIDLKDALGWLRGSHPDVASDVSLAGTAVSTASFAGWPLRLAKGSTVIRDAELSSPRLRVPAHLSQFQLRYDNGAAFLLPGILFFGPLDGPDGSFRFDSPVSAARRDQEGLHLAGNLPQVRDLIATASALGWNISRGWDLSGPMRCDLRWPGDVLPWNSQPSGSIEWGIDEGEASLLTPFVNEPLRGIRARAELKTDSRHITLSAAEAFGAHWEGTFDRRDDGEGWQFAASADHLAVADLDRWLNPRWKASFIYRVLPFLNPNSPTNSVPENFRASGRLSIDEFTLASVALKHLHGEAVIGGRHIQLSNAKAQLYDGTLDGSFDAELTATPAYRVRADFGRVDLAALTAASPSLATLFAGAASGDIALNFAGANQSDLFSSLRCRGSARISNPEIRTANLIEIVRDAAFHPGSSAFREGAAAFTCGKGRIDFQDISLVGATQSVQGSGFINYDRTLEMRLRPVTAGAIERNSKPNAERSGHAVELTGSLGKPDVRRVETASPR
jgi:hypothetical protein